MGPAPMIRIVEISFLFGIKSHGRGNWAQKKGAHSARPSSQERVFLARGWSLDQISQPRKGQTRPSTGNLGHLSAIRGVAQPAPPGTSDRPGLEPEAALERQYGRTSSTVLVIELKQMSARHRQAARTVSRNLPTSSLRRLLSTESD